MRHMSRRTALRQTGAAALLAAGGTHAGAQTAGEWPNKPIRIIVNFAPGGGSDNAIRPFTPKLSQLLGQQVVIENRGGASGAVGVEAVIKSPADGYTFLGTPSLTLVTLPHLRKLTFDPFKDLVPVTKCADGMLLVAVHPSVSANSLPELADYAKKNPGKLSWGTPGVGTFGHLTCESFKHHAGVDILHVPYRGTGDLMGDFLAGVVQIQIDPITLQHVPTGKAKLLAVFGKERRPDYPNVPLVSDSFPQLDFSVWFGLYAPAGTPQAVVERMAKATSEVASDPQLKQQLFPLAITPTPGTPAELSEITRRDHEKYGAIIRQFGIKAE